MNFSPCMTQIGLENIKPMAIFLSGVWSPFCSYRIVEKKKVNQIAVRNIDFLYLWLKSVIKRQSKKKLSSGFELIVRRKNYF